MVSGSFLSLFAINGFAQIPGDAYFSAPVVHDISIEFDDPNWYNILVQYKSYSDNLDSNVYLPATVTIDATVIDSVGVRFKGNSSYYNYPTNKKPFKLDFNEFVSGQKFDGLKKMNLNNLYQDPTFLREKMFLDFIQAHGLYGPRATYSRVYVNSVYWGLYLSVDQIDKTYVNREFGNNDSNLFKGDGSASSCANLKYHGTMSSYYNCYELKTNETANDWTDLVDLTYQINQTTAQQFEDSVEAVLNTNSFLGAWASYSLFADYDSYPYRFSHNYYVYHNSVTDKFEWIVWDVSTAFGLDIPLTVSQVENLSAYYIWPNETDRPLSYLMLQNANYTQRFTDLLCQYIGDFEPSVQFPIIDSLYAAIQADVYADGLKMYTDQQFDANVLNTVNINGNDVPGLKSFITNRHANVLAEITQLGCSPTGISDLNIEDELEVSVYPNPANGQVTIELREPIESWSWTLYNAHGQIIRQIENISGQRFTTDLEPLSRGIYVYQMKMVDGKTTTGKLEIER